MQPALPEEPRADEPLCSSSDPSCCDLPPPEFTCAEQSNFGKCNENWMLVGAGQGSFCDLTCGRCGGGFAPAPTNDDAPSTAPLFADAPDFAVSPGASPSPPFSLSSPSSPSSFSPFPSPAPPQGQEERGGGRRGRGRASARATGGRGASTRAVWAALRSTSQRSMREGWWIGTSGTPRSGAYGALPRVGGRDRGLAAACRSAMCSSRTAVLSPGPAPSSQGLHGLAARMGTHASAVRTLAFFSHNHHSRLS